MPGSEGICYIGEKNKQKLLGIGQANDNIKPKKSMDLLMDHYLLLFDLFTELTEQGKLNHLSKTLKVKLMETNRTGRFI